MNNFSVENINHLKILGLIFDSKHNFKEHCSYLRSSLAARLNLIKYLSSNKSQIHTNTLLNITQLTLISKLDYGLAIYGNCAKSHLSLIKGPYQAAIRSSLRAFRTTPIENLLAESGFLNIQDRIHYITCRQIPVIYSTSNSILSKEITLLKRRKRSMKLSSALTCILDVVSKSNITPLPSPTWKHPPWLMQDKSFLSELTLHAKQSTNVVIYRQLYWQITDPFLQKGWQILFTDGSKSIHGTSFAVVDVNGKILAQGILPTVATAFDAEVQGIFSALLLVKSSKDKFIVCTDSLSVFEAAKSTSNSSESISTIKELIIQLDKRVKLMWIPGHAGINGNEHADKAAKLASKAPLVTFMPFSRKDVAKIISKFVYQRSAIQWANYSHPYKSYNPNRTAVRLPTTTTTAMNKCFIRLRLGHTSLTHAHLLNKEPQPTCKFCLSAYLTIPHILKDCPLLAKSRTISFSNLNPFELLTYPQEKNIKLIFEFCKNIHIHKLI